MPRKFTKRSNGTSLSYQVDIAKADAAKEEMGEILETNDQNVLNRVGAFASLYDAKFPGYKHPVLVMKTEEPGTKQLLAFQHGRIGPICEDMINHLINDIAVMGATPLCVQDAIICGKLERPVVMKIVKGIASACHAQGCVLVGGETSEQPGMLEAGKYILASSVVGVVEKDRIIDGSAIKKGDIVLALESSGIHTNGYTLVRLLMAEKPEILVEKVGGRPFLDAILTPHRCYFQALRGIFDVPELHGLAHITGGGIAGNLNRILPKELNASVDLGSIRILPIFSLIREMGNVTDAEMLRTFNLGVGLTAVVKPDAVDVIRNHLSKQGVESYPIGEIVEGKKTVQFHGELQW